VNPKKLIDKEHTLGNVVKVFEILEYIVLAELYTHGPNFQQQLEQRIITILGGVGVNKGFLSQRINSLLSSGKIEDTGIDPNHRSRHILKITPEGVNYLKDIMKDVPQKLKLALSTYTAFEKYMTQYGKMSLKKNDL